jgi:phenylalanyl-tRNA synthetase beta chain
VLVDGVPVGHAGELAPEVVAAFGVAAPAAALEVDVEALRAGARRDRTFRSLSRFPASTVDLAFAVPDTVTAAAVAATIAASDPLVESVRTFDEFRSESLPPGTRSLAFALRYRAPDRTLTDAEVGALREAAIDAVTRTHGATLR